VTAVLATLPAALAQNKPDTVLPPPSLYDELGPGAPTAPQATTPTKQAPQAAAQPKPAPQAAPAPAKPAPQSVQASKPAGGESEPWYKSMFSWIGGGSAKPAQQKMMAAPSAGGAKSMGPMERSEYAYDSPNRVIRTGVLGQCVKTGLWTRGAATEQCDPGMMTAKKPVEKPMTVAAAAPVPVAQPKHEPVEVQPLAPAPVKEERVLEPEPVAAPRPAPAPPPTEVTTLSADALFAINSAALKPTAKERLDAFAARMKEMDYQTIRVTGHTDPTGSAPLNERLSRQRAETVKRYLVARGLDADKIMAEGMGSALPMVTNRDCSSLPKAKKIACYQPDRRVEIEVSGVMHASAASSGPRKN
jgi:OOP family OmpA-OmpF porin